MAAYVSTVVDMLAVRIDMCQYVLVTSPPASLAHCCQPTGGSPLTESEAEHLAGVLKALADPVRLRLVSAVAAAPDGEACACDLPALVDRSQPTVSHHLKILVEASVLDREQRGKWAWFTLNEDRLATLSQAIEPS